MSKFIDIVHKCVTPKVLPEYGDNTVWECDCGQKWVLTIRYRNIYGETLSFPKRKFELVGLHEWNETENRLKTSAELSEAREEWRKRHLENQTKFIEAARKNRWKLPFLNN